MINSYFPQLLSVLPSSFGYAFFVAVLGAFLALSFHIAFGAFIAIPKLYTYLKSHSNAVVFTVGSIIRNVLYGNNLPFKIIQHDSGVGLPFRVVIIPGTWSPEKYDWNRWAKYMNSFQQCGSSVYKLQWQASNSEKSRSEAARHLRTWLDRECEGVEKVVVIGHSYGGHVAALVRDHPLVTEVVTLAAPFVSTENLKNEQIASSALALFTRAFLFPTAIWLAYTAYMIYYANGIVGMTQPQPGWDTYVAVVGIGTFLSYIIFLVVRLCLSMGRPQVQVSIPTQTANGASTICVQVNGDVIVEQLESSASSVFSQADSSSAFLKQEAIQPNGFRKWALPYYFLCVFFIAHAHAFPQVATIFEVITTGRDNHTLQALQGYFLFILYALLARVLARFSSAARNIKMLLSDLSKLVDWDAMARDNRRCIICLLAGLPLHARLVNSVYIRAGISGATIWKVDLPKSPTGLHKHSDVIEDEDTTLKVLDFLCARLKQNTSA